MSYFRAWIAAAILLSSLLPHQISQASVPSKNCTSLPSHSDAVPSRENATEHDYAIFRGDRRPGILHAPEYAPQNPTESALHSESQEADELPSFDAI